MTITVPDFGRVWNLCKTIIILGKRFDKSYIATTWNYFPEAKMGNLFGSSGHFNFSVYLKSKLTKTQSSACFFKNKAIITQGTIPCFKSGEPTNFKSINRDYIPFFKCSSPGPRPHGKIHSLHLRKRKPKIPMEPTKVSHNQTCKNTITVTQRTLPESNVLLKKRGTSKTELINTLTKSQSLE